MRYTYKHTLVVVIIFLVVAGVIVVGHDMSEGTDGEDQNQSTGGKLTQTARIGIGTLERYNDTTNGSFRLYVSTTVRGYKQSRYEDVQLCLYGSDGRVLDKHDIGTVMSPKNGEFDDYQEVKTYPGERPRYITVDHPKLRNDTRFSIDLYEWNENMDVYQLRQGKQLNEIQNSFEWPRTNQTGECG